MKTLKNLLAGAFLFFSGQNCFAVSPVTPALPNLSIPDLIQDPFIIPETPDTKKKEPSSTNSEESLLSQEQFCIDNFMHWNTELHSCEDLVTSCSEGFTIQNNTCVNNCLPATMHSSYNYVANDPDCPSAVAREEDQTCWEGLEPVPCPEESIQPQITFSSLSTCRSRGYEGEDCAVWSTERQEDLNRIDAREEELQIMCAQEANVAVTTCNEHVVTASQRVVESGRRGGGSGESFSELACQVAETGQSAISEVSSLQTTCESIVDSCNSTCNRSVSILWTSVSVNDSRCGNSVKTQLSEPFISQVSSLQTSINSAESTCLAGREPEEEDSGNQFLNNATQVATAVAATALSQSSGGELSGGGGGSSFSGSNSNTSFAANPNGRGNIDSDFSLNNPSGSSSPVASSNVDGVGDEAVLPNGQGGPGQSGGLGGGAGGNARGRTARAGGGFGGGGPSSSKLGANSGKRKSYKSAKARNLIGGYKKVKSSDGGASVAIKPSDFKKFGALSLKNKLAEARKRHGKDLPLIFKNGKFVLDFLAMKESKAFKAKTAAMESYMKGGSRDVATAKELNVHQNPKLNIFKIMNFRYHRQDFSEN